tara:strand:+ start:849 stop:1715 length:867 start_codon:yes stop_codon:yes gene_type:complete
MKFTNIYNLEDIIVNALMHDEYTSGGADYSMTTLLKAPQQIILERENKNALTQDVSDLIFSRTGTWNHEGLEKGNKDNKDIICEKRHTIIVNGKNISGATDVYHTINHEVIDYKTTSYYAVKDALNGGKIKPDWEKQLNGYAYMWRANGFTVRGLKIIAILRDWSRATSMRDSNYPRTPIVSLNVPLWKEDEQHDFIVERVGVHELAKNEYEMTGELPQCTDEERWKIPDKWALMNKGKKRALKLYTSEEDAKENMGENNHIEFREGKANKCESYCPANQFCSQFLGK